MSLFFLVFDTRKSVSHNFCELFKLTVLWKGRIQEKFHCFRGASRLSRELLLRKTIEKNLMTGALVFKEVDEEMLKICVGKGSKIRCSSHLQYNFLSFDRRFTGNNQNRSFQPWKSQSSNFQFQKISLKQSSQNTASKLWQKNFPFNLLFHGEKYNNDLKTFHVFKIFYIQIAMFHVMINFTLVCCIFFCIVLCFPSF